MYVPGEPPVIICSSQRNLVRKVFTCAHELGHHILEHGMSTDEMDFDTKVTDWEKEEEYQATCFGGSFLMPASAVNHAFKKRKWEMKKLEPTQFFAVSNYLRVGYETLIRHMQSSLGLITWEEANILRKNSPKSLKRQILQEDCRGHLMIIDQYWDGQNIDVEVGDKILFPFPIHLEQEGFLEARKKDDGVLLTAEQANIATAS